MNSYEKWINERDAAIGKFANLALGEMDFSLWTIKDINDLTTLLEEADINLETDKGLEQLAEIVSSFEKDDRIALMYNGQCIDKILTNHSMSVDDAIQLLKIDISEMDAGDPVWDYELFDLQY